MTSDNKPATSGADGVAAIIEALQTSSLQELGYKVFVGNLNFATKEDQLRELFGKHGNITDVQIIHRGTRSLGYGFVTFETRAEAEMAISNADKVELDGRTINVEIAKPTPGTPGGAVPRAAAKAAKAAKASKSASAAKENGDHKASDEDKENQTDHTDGPRRSTARRGKGRARGRSGRGGRLQSATESKEEVNGDDHGAATDTSAPNDGDQSAKPASKRGRGRRTKKAPRAEGAPRGEGRPRRVGAPEGEPSKTLLFVANLPFGLTDEGLKEFFSSYQVASAHVVRRRYGSSLGRSKGFGFVEFESEDGQLKALAETQGKELEGRALQVKVAVSEAKKEAEDAAKADESGEAGAVTATA